MFRRDGFGHLAGVGSGGAGLEVGGIGVFGADPGADYVPCDGRILKRADYPGLVGKLKMVSGFAAQPLIPTNTAQQNRPQMCAGGNYVFVIGFNSSVLYRSIDGGGTFATIATPTMEGRSTLLICSPSGQYVWQIAIGEPFNSQVHRYSSDYGASWVGRVANNADSLLINAACWSSSPYPDGFFLFNQQTSTVFLSSKDGTHISTMQSYTRNQAKCVSSPEGVSIAITYNATTFGRSPSIYSAFTNTDTAGGNAIRDVAFANGVFMLATNDGLYRSINGGQTFTRLQITPSACLGVVYGAGRFIAQFENADTSNLYVGSSDGATFVPMASLSGSPNQYIAPFGLVYSGKIFVAHTYSSVVGTRLYRTLDSDPASEFTLAPKLADDNLIAPQTYRMRVK